MKKTSSNGGRSERRSLLALVGPAIAAIVILPILSVLLLVFLADGGTEALQRKVIAAADRADAHPDQLATIAEEARVDILLVSPEGEVIERLLHAPRRQNLGGVASFGVQPAPVPEDPSAELARRWSREGDVDLCRRRDDGARVACESRRSAGDGRLLIVSRSAGRGIGRLAEPLMGSWIRPVLVFGGGTALLGLLLGAFLLRRIRRPLRELQRSVAERRDLRDLQPIQIEGSEEIVDVSRAFNRLLERLKGLEGERARLVEDLAHEIKTPLASIRLSLEGHEGADARSREKLGRIGRSVERIDQTLRSLLELSRIEEGVSMSERSRFAIDELARNVALSLEVADENIALGATDIELDADAELLGRALGALIENALVYGEGRCDIETGADAEYVWIRVYDDGPGVDERERERIFERFVSHREGGSGIGLSLARAAARAHGGELVLLESERTTFELRLPRS